MLQMHSQLHKMLSGFLTAKQWVRVRDGSGLGNLRTVRWPRSAQRRSTLWLSCDAHAASGRKDTSKIAYVSHGTLTPPNAADETHVIFI